MSLLDQPPHTVLVQQRVTSSDGRGKSGPLNQGARVLVACSVQPLSSADRLVLGGVVADTKRNIVARSWPGNSLSSVIWDGHFWDTEGEPEHFMMSPATDHWEIRIAKRGEDG